MELIEGPQISFLLGETWVVAFALKNADGEPLDLSGAAVVFRAALRAAPIGVVVTAILLEAVADIENATAGLGEVRVVPAAQVGLTAGIYRYELRATLADGTVTTQQSGELRVEPTLF